MFKKKYVAIALGTVSILLGSAYAYYANPDIVGDFDLEPFIVTPYHDDAPSLFQDSTSKIWVFYTSNTWPSYPYYRKGIFYITSTDMGNTWSDAEELEPAHEDGPEQFPFPRWPSAFEDSTGKMWVAWQRWTAACVSDIYYTTSTDGGITWSDREELVSYPGDDWNGCFIEVEGRVWYVFCPYSLGFWDVHYKVWLDGYWSDPVKITDADIPTTADAIVDFRGTIWVVNLRGGREIWYKTSADNGTSWSLGEKIPSTEGSEHPRIVEYSGMIYVFYNIGVGPVTVRDIWCTASADYGDTWSEPRQLTPSDSNADYQPWPSEIGTQLWFVWTRGTDIDKDIWLARPKVVSSTIDIDPDTLNLKSNGEWITAYIELPEGYHASDIDVSTIQINGTILVDLSAPTEIGDYDLDGMSDLMAKFDRFSIIEWLDTADYSEDIGKSYHITFTITGKVLDMTFEGSDIIKVLRK